MCIRDSPSSLSSFINKSGSGQIYKTSESGTALFFSDITDCSCLMLGHCVQLILWCWCHFRRMNRQNNALYCCHHSTHQQTMTLCTCDPVFAVTWPDLTHIHNMGHVGCWNDSLRPLFWQLHAKVVFCFHVCLDPFLFCRLLSFDGKVYTTNHFWNSIVNTVWALKLSPNILVSVAWHNRHGKFNQIMIITFSACISAEVLSVQAQCSFWEVGDARSSS